MAINIRVELIHFVSNQNETILKAQRDQETLKECSDFILFDEENVKLAYFIIYLIFLNYQELFGS